MPVKQAVLMCLCIAGPVCAETATLPLEERPAWLRREGIVMAGSWEALPFRVRRDGAPGYTPTPEQHAAWTREHSPEMIARLKTLGVNFVMMHCHKGGGFGAEAQSMADAVKFSKLCHDAGMHVGVYNYSGAFMWELLFKEVPRAKDWVVLDKDGKPRTYGKATYRYYWNRNHPDAQAFYRQLVRFAVEEIKTDLVHFDNYTVGPGRDANSVQRFRQYLRDTFTPQQLNEMGVTNLDEVQPPMTGPPDNMLRRAWLEFSCRSLADSYWDMGRYARSLRKDILVECNPGGIGGRIRSPVDHGRLLQGGEAYWDEGRRSGCAGGQLHTRIRTYKVARRMDNMAFAYSLTPLEAAEAMAFNLDCLGCICWFEYDRIVDLPASKEPVSKELAPFVRFFHRRRELLRDAEVVADVAVLRSFPSQVFASPQSAQLTYRVEEALIRNRRCFQIIFDHQLDDLKRYRAVVLAGCVALSDEQVEQIRRFTASGGRVCVIGPVATHDQWMTARDKPALDDLPPASAVRIAETDDLLEATDRACGGELSLSIKAKSKPRVTALEKQGVPLGLCAELTEQPHRRLVHLVNYRDDGPIDDVEVNLRLPAGRKAKAVELASPEHEDDRAVPFEQQPGVVTFTVPEVGVYEIAVVTTSG